MIVGSTQLTLMLSLAQLGRHRLGQADHRGLGGDVRTHPCRAALRVERRVGRDIDDAAAALREHPWHHRARGVQHRAHVEVVEEVPVGVRRLVHRAAHAKAAGQVAQHVDAAEARDRRCHRGIDLLRIEQVERREQAFGALVAEGARQAFGFRRDQHQLRAACGEGRGHRAAEVAAGAGDHDAAVIERVVGPRLCLHGDRRRAARPRGRAWLVGAPWTPFARRAREFALGAARRAHVRAPAARLAAW